MPSILKLPFCQDIPNLCLSTFWIFRGTTSVLSLSIQSPEHTENFSNNNSEFFREEIPARVASSASWHILNSSLFIIMPLMSLLFLMLIAKISTTRINRRTERRQPCLIPLSRVKNSQDLPLFVTQLSILVYSIFTQYVKVSPKLKALRHFNRKGQSTVSKAFWKSIWAIWPFCKVFLH